MTVNIILSRLAAQLISRSNTIPPQLQEAYYKTKIETAILLQVIGTALGSIPTFMVLDALDEFTSSSQPELIKILLDLAPYLHIFVTTRHIPESLPAHPSQVIINLNASNHTDLEYYTQAQIAAFPFMRSRKPETKRALIDQVVEASSGLFLLANLHIHELRACLSLMKAQSIAAQLPRTPNERYRDSIRRIQAKDPHPRELAMHTLMWIWAARQPITLGELSLAVASSTEDLTDQAVEDAVVDGAVLLDLCDGLVVVGSEQVQFIHFTTEEYFNSEGPKIFEDMVHTIGPGCLGYLNASHSLEMIQLLSKQWVYHTPYRGSDEGRFFYYCSLFWEDHAHGSLADVTTGLFRLLEKSAYFVLYARIKIACRRSQRRGQGYWTVHVRVDADSSLAACVTGLLDGYLGSMQGDIIAKHGESILAKAGPRGTARQSLLLLACTYGHLQVVELLIARNDVDINSQDEIGRSPLSLSCENGYDGVVVLFLARNDVQVNSQDMDGRTSLFLACVNRRYGVMELLLARNDIDVNSQDMNGISPLLWAYQNGHSSSVELLLTRNDIQVNIRDTNGGNALLWACEDKHYGIMELLLARNDVEANIRDKDGRSPLSLAYERVDIKGLELLLACNNVEVDSQDMRGISLLWAYENGYYRLVEVLLARSDVDVNSQEMNGRSLLLLACACQDVKFVELLVGRSDIDANSCEFHGQSLLSWACWIGNIHMAKLFLARKDIQVNYQDKNGRSPISWTCKKGHFDILRLLLVRNDVDVNSRDSNGRSPFSWACQNGCLEVVKLLADRDDVEADSRDEYGQSPLSWASKHGHLKVVELLVARCDVEADSRDNNGQSPLSLACEHGHDEVAKFLLARDDVDADSRDNHGQSPFLWAFQCGHLDVTKLLVGAHLFLQWNALGMPLK
ncbi:ankyrin repeat-containing domain protein [Flagelloscypha sp. PMI_526]|nr:ankyrin repeat-containing domain protein [Flagelloscypha sp. PMI_526]